MPTREELERFTKELIDQGKLIEAGFVGLQIACMDPTSPEIQVREMRMAFMAGALHLFNSIMTILDPGEEPTDEDLRRMALINKELVDYGEAFTASIKTQGRMQ